MNNNLKTRRERKRDMMREIDASQTQTPISNADWNTTKTRTTSISYICSNESELSSDSIADRQGIGDSLSRQIDESVNERAQNGLVVEL